MKRHWRLKVMVDFPEPLTRDGRLETRVPEKEVSAGQGRPNPGFPHYF